MSTPRPYSLYEVQTGSEQTKKLISVVTPCYNEEANVYAHFERVKKAVSPFSSKYDFEHIYTDNCSHDRTFDLLTALAKSNPEVKVMRFSRNIGANRAIYIGLTHAQGDSAILIQADLQDPPEVIPEFIVGWEEGNEIVYGQITNRKENWVLKSMRKVYYKIISLLADVAPPVNAGEFRLMSRKILDAMKLYREDDIYLRGVMAHIGFRQRAVPYERSARAAGKASSSLAYYVSYALNGLLSTSTVAPIRAVFMVGLLTASVGFGYCIFIVVAKLMAPDRVPKGIASVVALVTFFSGVQLFALGIIGEYIRKIYVQSLNRPTGFIQDTINFKN
jgi:polyisoprenyl-phosphate glycosyltransferase